MINKIKIGQIFNYYDNGKFINGKISNHYDFIVTDIIPFNNAPEDLINLWVINTTKFKSYFKSNTEYFIVGNIMMHKDNNIISKEILCQTNDDSWFSISGSDYEGVLDLDNEIYNYLEEFKRTL